MVGETWFGGPAQTTEYLAQLQRAFDLRSLIRSTTAVAEEPREACSNLKGRDSRVEFAGVSLQELLIATLFQDEDIFLVRE